MKILFVGGGSGGHVTPLKAIIAALPDQAKHQLTVMTDRRFYAQTQHIFTDMPTVSLRRIFAGKYRRYHGHSFLQHVTHLPTLLLNIRDIFFLALGCLQAFGYMLVHRPNVVFAKGGFVSLPVGVAARLLRIPLVIHDSDTHPGLTSRILSRWAVLIATGMPPEHYPYPKAKMRYTGIPTAVDFRPVTPKQRRARKTELGFTVNQPLLLITGGGTGAQRLNEYCTEEAADLLQNGWQLAHFTGAGKSGGVLQARARLPQKQQKYWQVHEFGDLAPYVQAADIIISRAGASALQEFANAKKAVIIVPSPYLSGGHQIKNARLFEAAQAVMSLQETALAANPAVLSEAVAELQKDDATLAKQLAQTLHKKFARPHAASQLAESIIAAGQ